VLAQRRDARIDRGGDVHEVRRVAGSRHVRVPDRPARRSSLGERSFAGCVAASVEHREPDRAVIGVIDRTLLAPGKVEGHRDDHLGLKLAVARSRRSEKAPIRAGQRWPVERTNAWHNAFGRLQRCYERHVDVVDAFFDLADTIITVRSLIRRAWTIYRWDSRPARRP
jgi:hypothetical protein